MSSAVTITSNTTINGSGYTLTASGLTGSAAGRHFEVNNGASLTINSITLTGGGVPNSGGSIYNNGTVTINSSFITGNSTTNNNTDPLVGGGALYNNSGSTMTINNSTVSYNSTPRLGGGIFNNGGTLYLTNVQFGSNTATADITTRHIQGTYNGSGTFTPYIKTVVKYNNGVNSTIGVEFENEVYTDAAYINSVVSYVCGGSPVTLNLSSYYPDGFSRFGTAGYNNYQEITFIGSAPLSNTCTLTLNIFPSGVGTAYNIMHTG
jgi:hypothetical protein